MNMKSVGGNTCCLKIMIPMARDIQFLGSNLKK